MFCQLDLSKLVLLLGSKSVKVQRSTALVIGNISQDDFNRERLGAAGAVEALFMCIAEADDYIVRVVATGGVAPWLIDWLVGWLVG